MTRPVVLITGASSGIGHATALRLVEAGFAVVASGRKMAALEPLAKAGCHVVRLDVADEQSRLEAMRWIEAEVGPVDILLNNAGYSQTGPVEDVDIGLWQQQFETNVLGLVRMCQLVLPQMRARQRGRIINVGSMGGVLSIPGGAAYHASKHAVEAISDVLRFEVKGFGVDVVLIQPGLVRTAFDDTLQRQMVERPGAYAAWVAVARQRYAEVYTSRIAGRIGGSAEDVAWVIEEAIRAPRPRTRYTVTRSALLGMWLRRWLPDRWWDWILETGFPHPGQLEGGRSPGAAHP